MKRVFLLSKECNFNIVLYQPDIPQNVGNIARLCVATSSVLHLIKPLGFSLADKKLKRAGLDYWMHLKFFVYNSWSEFLLNYAKNRMFFLTTKSNNLYFNVSFLANDFFIFGSESQGLPSILIEEYYDQVLNIPMNNNVRSLNLSNCASIILYEAIRQVCFSK